VSDCKHALTVRSWMNASVVTIDAAAGLGQAARTIASQMISCVIVVENGNPVGIITERDVAVCAAVQESHSINEVPVREVMGTPLVGVAPNDSIEDALLRVARLHIRHVPVLDDKGALVGILTQTDLLKACMELAGLRLDPNLDDDEPEAVCSCCQEAAGSSERA